MLTNYWYERVERKLGFTRALDALDTCKGAMHNYLHGAKRVPNEVVYRALQHLEEGEFNEIARRRRHTGG